MIVDYWIEIAKQRMASKGMMPNEIFQAVETQIIPRINNRTQLAIQNAMDEAMNTAISSLGGQAEEYIRALRVESDYDCHIIGLAVDAHPLEYGQAEIDLIPTLLSSGNAKVSKDGTLYTIVPMNKQTGEDPEVTADIKRNRLEAALKSAFGEQKWDAMVDFHFESNTTYYKGGQTRREPTEFRTVSEKTNPNTWKIPARPGLQQLDGINARLKAEQLEAILDELRELL